jgi:hypothetical protein
MKSRLLKRNRFGVALITTMLILSSGAHAQENWGPAESIITESWNDFCIGYGFCQPSISSNDSLLFFSYFCFDSSGIAYSIYEDGVWQSPVAFPIGIEEDWLSPVFYYNAIDTFFYFSSYDTGGYGSSDLWAIQFISGSWGEPYNLGPVINTAASEHAPSLSNDFSRLYFERGETIMYSEIVNGQFTDPLPLPPEINSDYLESFPRISRDGQRIYFNRLTSYFHLDSLLVSYLTNGVWSDPVSLNGNINFNHNNSYCGTIPAGSYNPTFSATGEKIYFSRFEPMGYWCDPGLSIMVSELITDIDPTHIPTPSTLSLSAHPNPFNSTTNISIDGNLEAVSEIAIYDITGRRIKSFAPSTRITWDGADSRGAPVSSGIYFVKAKAWDFEKSLRITFLK